MRCGVGRGGTSKERGVGGEGKNNHKRQILSVTEQDIRGNGRGEPRKKYLPNEILESADKGRRKGGIL